MDPDERKELLERWKVAHAEYRAEVALGWDRTKFYLTLNTAVTAWVASSSAPGYIAHIVLGLGALVALAGTLLVRRSHGRYQAARAVVLRLEDELGFADLQTTGGQRQARELPRLERFRVVDVVTWTLVLIALADVVLALSWSR